MATSYIGLVVIRNIFRDGLKTVHINKQNVSLVWYLHRRHDKASTMELILTRVCHCFCVSQTKVDHSCSVQCDQQRCQSTVKRTDTMIVVLAWTRSTNWATDSGGCCSRRSDDKRLQMAGTSHWSSESQFTLEVSGKHVSEERKPKNIKEWLLTLQTLDQRYELANQRQRRRQWKKTTPMIMTMKSNLLESPIPLYFRPFVRMSVRMSQNLAAAALF